MVGAAPFPRRPVSAKPGSPTPPATATVMVSGRLYTLLPAGVMIRALLVTLADITPSPSVVTAERGMLKDVTRAVKPTALVVVLPVADRVMFSAIRVLVLVVNPSAQMVPGSIDAVTVNAVSPSLSVKAAGFSDSVISLCRLLSSSPSCCNRVRRLSSMGMVPSS